MVTGQGLRAEERSGTQYSICADKCWNNSGEENWHLYACSIMGKYQIKMTGAVYYLGWKF